MRVDSEIRCDTEDAQTSKRFASKTQCEAYLFNNRYLSILDIQKCGTVIIHAYSADMQYSRKECKNTDPTHT